MSALARRGALSRPADGPVVLVTSAGAASGSRAAAAALACAASEPDRAALLVEIGDGRPPRSSLISTVGARRLEERLATHLPDAAIASRGRYCQLTLPPDRDAIDELPSALPLVRESTAVVHLAPPLLRPALEAPRLRATAALLRADLTQDRALTALAVRELLDGGLRVAVLKHPPSWFAARAALLGALPASSSTLPNSIRCRLLSTEDKRFQDCYDRTNGAEGERGETQQQTGRGEE